METKWTLFKGRVALVAGFLTLAASFFLLCWLARTSVSSFEQEMRETAPGIVAVVKIVPGYLLICVIGLATLAFVVLAVFAAINYSFCEGEEAIDFGCFLIKYGNPIILPFALILLLIRHTNGRRQVSQ